MRGDCKEKGSFGIDDTYNTCYYLRGKEMKFREIDRIIRSAGWHEVRQKGSHHQYKHKTKPGTVTIPDHGGKDIHPDTVKSIRKQAGLD